MLKIAGDETGIGCTSWMDRDDPWKGLEEGDNETIVSIFSPLKPPTYVVQARLKCQTITYNSPQEVKADLNQNVTFVVNSYQSLGVGMYCRNKDQNGTICPHDCYDYEARFCCGKLNLLL